MKRILPERPLSQVEKNRRWAEKNKAKSTSLTFILSDPEELAIYEFLNLQSNKRRTIIDALKLYMNTLDK